MKPEQLWLFPPPAAKGATRWKNPRGVIRRDRRMELIVDVRVRTLKSLQMRGVFYTQPHQLVLNTDKNYSLYTRQSLQFLKALTWAAGTFSPTPHPPGMGEKLEVKLKQWPMT